MESDHTREPAPRQETMPLPSPSVAEERYRRILELSKTPRYQAMVRRYYEGYV